MDNLSENFHKHTGIKPIKVSHPLILVLLAALQSSHDRWLCSSHVEDACNWLQYLMPCCCCSHRQHGARLLSRRYLSSHSLG